MSGTHQPKPAGTSSTNSAGEQARHTSGAPTHTAAARRALRSVTWPCSRPASARDELAGRRIISDVYPREFTDEHEAAVLAAASAFRAALERGNLRLISL